MSFWLPGRSRGRRRIREASFQSSAQSLPGWNTVLQTCVDFGIAVTIFLVPFVMGGREAPGRLVLTLSVSLSVLAWILLQVRSSSARWIWTRAEPILILGAALLIFQMMTLPITLIELLSPAQSELLQAWRADSTLGEWRTISLTPRRSVDGLVMFINYALLFLLVVQRIGDRKDAARLLKWIGASGALMGAFALLQYATSNGRFFWVYDHPFVDTSQVIKGAFTNRNHFAHFMALSLGPLIWWTASGTQQRTGSKRRSDNPFGATDQGLPWLPILGMIIVVFTGLMSLSRGGVVSLCLAALTGIYALYRSGWLELRMLMAFCVLGVVLAGLLLAFGGESVDSRLDTMVSGDIEQLDRSEGRRTIWRATWQGIQEFPLFGTGVGSLREIYPVFSDGGGLDTEFTHAESGYLQVGMESGVVGFLLLSLGLLLCLSWGIRVFRSSAQGDQMAIAGAALAGVVVSMIHSAGDFVWYVPGCVSVTVVLIAILCRMTQIIQAERSEDSTGASIPRRTWISTAVILVPLFGMMVWNRWNPVPAEARWYDYLRSVRFQSELGDSESAFDSNARTYSDVKLLMACVQADPTQSRAHARLALLYTGIFDVLQQSSENRMSVAQIRDTVESAGFESQEALDEWLDRAIGTNIKLLHAARHHAGRAVLMCPLRGEAYIHLGQLQFLDHADQTESTEYFQQALAVRPHDAFVLYHFGREAWLLGEYNDAVRYWKEAFHQDDYFQQRILDLLVDHVPASFILERFEPEWPALRVMVHRYADETEDHRLVLAELAEASRRYAEESQGGTRIKALLEGYMAFGRLGKARTALECLIKAVRTDPMAFEPRYEIGAWFYHRGRYDEALKHLQWCALQRPDDQRIERLIDKAATARLQGGSGPMSADSQSDSLDGSRYQ